MARIAGYTFNEGTGTTAAEVAGGAAITGVPGWATGRHGNAMNVTGSGPTITPYASDTNFTIMFDVYITAVGGWGYNVFLDGGTAGFGVLQTNSTGSGSLEWYHDSAGIAEVAVPSLTLNTWHTITVRADGSTRSLLFDTTLIGSRSTSTRAPNNPLQLGGQPGASSPSNFRMDNLRFYNTALTDAEVASLVGVEVGAEAGVVSINDNVGITDARSIGSSARSVSITDSVGIADTGAQQTFDWTEFRPDPIGISDVVTPTLTTSGGPVSPTANAGPDQTVDPNTLVTLNGTGSTIPAGQTAKSWVWSQLSGPAVTLSGSGAIRTFTATTAGTYVFSLVLNTTVDSTQQALQSTPDTVTVTVNAPPAPTTTPSIFYSDGVQWYAL